MPLQNAAQHMGFRKFSGQVKTQRPATLEESLVLILGMLGRSTLREAKFLALRAPRHGLHLLRHGGTKPFEVDVFVQVKMHANQEPQLSRMDQLTPGCLSRS